MSAAVEYAFPVGMLTRDQRTTKSVRDIKEERNRLCEKVNYCDCGEIVQEQDCEVRVRRRGQRAHFDRIKSHQMDLTIKSNLRSLKYFNSFLLFFCILLTVPSLSSARPNNFASTFLRHRLSKMASHKESIPSPLPETLIEICGSAMHQRRLNLTEIELMINRTLLLCNRAIVEAYRSGDNYTQELFNRDLNTYHSEWPDPTPEHLAWIFPNKKRLPKEFRKDLPDSYQKQLQTGDLNQVHSHATELLFDSYRRLLHLMHALNLIVTKIRDRGHREYASQDQLNLLNDTFQKAIDKSNEVLSEIKEGLKSIYECDIELEQLFDPRIVEDFEYREFNNWIIFREYANQLEFNIAAFKILLDRIRQLKAEQPELAP